ncbi:MAG: methionyl-tRNA formyltransferase, partial [Pedobacter sp.]
QEWNVKIYESEFEEQSHDSLTGTIVATKKEIRVAAVGGFIILKALQFPGKKKMTASELLNGMQFSENAIAL